MRLMTIIGFALSIISFCINICTLTTTENTNKTIIQTYVIIKSNNELIQSTQERIAEIGKYLEK